jgi:hypothetical protein
MNGRMEAEPTPEGRLAAVCKSLVLRMRRQAERRHRSDYSAEPDYADYRDALKPHLERELKVARLEELENYEVPAAVFRRQQLRQEIMALDHIIAKEAKK